VQVNFWKFSRNQQHLPAIHSHWLPGSVFVYLNKNTEHCARAEINRPTFGIISTYLSLIFFGCLGISFKCNSILARSFYYPRGGTKKKGMRDGWLKGDCKVNTSFPLQLENAIMLTLLLKLASIARRLTKNHPK
jgi:hypothetical protein